ncbi:MAG TPA: UDP-2,3-diacylglucosamine diphosphatase LpxI, partial [Gemmataceae bacterium]|nr:UDP-2,3-diacylglucosamine diphosphatase LpxI [Gemmataceae bacterium]
IGLLAGSGRFPVLFAETARQLGRSVVCVGIRDEAPLELIPLVDRFQWAGILKLGHMIRCFRREGVSEIVMAGKIQKTKLFLPFAIARNLPDVRTIRFFFRHWRRRMDNRDDTLLLSVIDEFGRDGLTFTSALDYCPELLVREGILTRRTLSNREEDDIRFGWTMAKELGRLDIGQSVVVKDQAVLAVEAIEGTDRAILRAGDLCRKGGFTVVKVAKPQQDMRFDVPTIGQNTIQTIHKAGGRVLAIEAGKTILLDEAATLALADRLGITIVARAA